ncbi:dihydrolipoamide acetyltransferase family protein [Mycobacterium sp. SP-6446]|uniref:dihydrolipoamide acetyltransferase family protein n=1 Tax=Mycobacterium sp. SP-6446 TaxID=1834162 RepID=UPI00096D9CC3|nr:dihydrolipoamide acetyltransferase family protein [Mycobacterium sp. SP-6446]OMC10569.1 hypothetical protein A5736_00075 [Mycobacterium sp. SP-6446]
MAIARFKLPDVGEGLTEAELRNWAVSVGDTVAVNQVLCEIETAKSAVELPSPVAGEVQALHVEEGDTVEVGAVIATFRVGGSIQRDLVAVPEMKALVGPGAGRRRHLRPRSDMPGPPRRVRETRVPINGVRKAVATAMTRSAFTAPHVTEWLAVDVTETVDLVHALRADSRWSGVRVNPMLFVTKALLIAVDEYPAVNTRWDEAHQEIVYHNYVNLGIAVATSRGLLVPNIKNAGDLALPELASALVELIDKARAGKATPADMSGGTITITNIGALGVDAGTPILNPGEAAILAFGAVRPTPWVVDGQITIRQITQLALSYDHRLIDGELGSNVLTRVASVLTKPVQTLLHTRSGPK